MFSSSNSNNDYQDMFPYYFEEYITKEYLEHVVVLMEELNDFKLDNKNSIDKVMSNWKYTISRDKRVFMAYNKHKKGFTYEVFEVEANCLNGNETTCNSEIYSDCEIINNNYIRTRCPYFGAVIELFAVEWSTIRHIVFEALMGFYDWGASIVACHTRPRPGVAGANFMSSLFSPFLVYKYADIFAPSLTYVQLLPNTYDRRDKNSSLGYQQCGIYHPLDDTIED